MSLKKGDVLTWQGAKQSSPVYGTYAYIRSNGKVVAHNIDFKKTGLPKFQMEVSVNVRLFLPRELMMNEGY